MARTPHMRYVRHRSFERLRHSRRFLDFLAEQGARLGVTAEFVFETLMKGQRLTAQQVADLDASPVDMAPQNTVLPAITGTPTVGQVLTASNGTWIGSPAPTYTRQWKRNGTNIASATGTTYTLVEADVGATITVTVTATNDEGNAAATSAGLGPVVAA